MLFLVKTSQAIIRTDMIMLQFLPGQPCLFFLQIRHRKRNLLFCTNHAQRTFTTELKEKTLCFYVRNIRLKVGESEIITEDIFVLEEITRCIYATLKR